jgi:hypothetical protein
MNDDIRSAFSRASTTRAAADELTGQLAGVDPVALVFFASHEHDGKALSAALRRRFPRAEVAGSTTAGEFTSTAHGTRSVSMLALGAGKVRRAAAALARFEGGVEAGVRSAAERLASRMEIDLRRADPKRYVGVALVEGLRMKEEAANDALGNVAPMLSFVGASAGDDEKFVSTRVFVNGEESDDGAALLLLDAAVPFEIGKTCSFEPTGVSFTVTRADVPNRIVHELDGWPVLEAYAKAVGVAPEKLDSGVFMNHPLGLLVDGQPWIRSPQRALPGGGLKLYCQLLEGTHVHLMKATDLVAGTREEMGRVKRLLGRPSGGLAFNCILRRLELDAKDQHAAFLEAFAGLEMAGFHTYGESWLGHINQTLTGLWFA